MPSLLSYVILFHLNDSAAPEEKNSKSLCSSNKAEEGFLEGSDQETVEVKCLNGSSLPGSPKSIQLQTNCEDAISQTNGQAMSQSELSQRIWCVAFSFDASNNFFCIFRICSFLF